MTSGGRYPMIYVAGSGHSGSTLLEMFVSGAQCNVGLGEIFQLVDRRNPIIKNLDGHLCSCGSGVADCVFWRPVIARLAKIPRGDENERYRALGEAVAAHFSPDTVMVDSSKTLDGLERAIASDAFDIKVLHLVRDVRSWLVSMQKSYRRNGVASWVENCKRAGLAKGTAKYLLRHPLADAWQWQRLNSRVEEVVTRNGLPLLPVSYERLCFNTENVKQEIEAFIDAPIADYGTPGVRTNNHSIFGNRMRFKPEKLQTIQYDNGWFHDTTWLLPFVLSPGLRQLNSRLGQGRKVS